ncbi:hypothetical protein GYK49_13685, partial [Lactobacillus paracasei]|nr:hypothetical protein [Lacticaseibacillus paracasei]
MKITKGRKMLVATGATVVAFGVGTVGVNADNVKAVTTNKTSPDTAANTSTVSSSTASIKTTTDPNTNTKQNVNSETDPATGKTTITITTSTTEGTPLQIANQQSKVNQASSAVGSAQSAVEDAQTKANAASAAASSAEANYGSAVGSEARTVYDAVAAGDAVKNAEVYQQNAQYNAYAANDTAIAQQQAIVDQAKAQT